jgi:hypothetical protein
MFECVMCHRVCLNIVIIPPKYLLEISGEKGLTPTCYGWLYSGRREEILEICKKTKVVDKSVFLPIIFLTLQTSDDLALSVPDQRYRF